MTALTDFWLSRRVQRTAATKVHPSVDPKIAKVGLGSSAGHGLPRLKDRNQSEPGIPARRANVN
jgi:hypothetical protein